MNRVNLASKEPCPKCGGDMQEGLNDSTPFEYCDRERDLLRGPWLEAWWQEHDKRCPGPGKCNEGPPVWQCDVEFSPARWLAEERMQGSIVVRQGKAGARC